MGWREYQYPHQEHMPYAREPLKSLYVAQRLLTTIALVPVWAAYYTVMPRSHRPRRSWSLKQIISVNFTRRVYKVTELAGVTWFTRDPDEPCDDRKLKETRFEWAPPLSSELRTGVIVDEQVPFKRVGMFIWPKVKPPLTRYRDEVLSAEASDSRERPDTYQDKVPVIGVFLHGGGYCHMSAHEKAGTSKIPRRLIQDQAFDEIYAVEYRLLQHAPFPSAVQDAATVYAHVLQQYSGGASQAYTSGKNSTDSTLTGDKDNAASHNTQSIGYLDPTRKTHGRTHAYKDPVPPPKNCKIILIGDSAGGNLVLALARWIRDEAILPPPDGLLLLSPSCDPSHAFPETPSSYIPRPHASTDYLVDTPEPRALLQRTFLGHHPLEMMHSPYVSPASHKVLRAFYGDLFVANIEDLTIHALEDRMFEHIRSLESMPSTPMPSFAAPVSTPAAECVNTASLNHPVIASPRRLSLFSEFPNSCVVLGDAERLEREVVKLVSAMERDAVPVRTVWVEDGPHDVLMMGWWDEKVRDRVWKDVEAWVASVARA